MTWTHSIPRPPVPQGINEALRDYPELIRIIQDDLEALVADLIRRRATFSAFEEAIWTLQGRLESFCIDADAELEAAEARRDTQAIAHADAKALRIGRILSSRPWNDNGKDNLSDYFQTYQRCFE